ncbi:hypothetical protein AAG906_007301 [Vitis piasezkii]|uniref:Plant bHLH transcription factor ACT-like domain-containing protein n=1 Tax=Vitis vinifera TaxID=29760 RepID=A0A438DBY7_VITVI|nr:hypothetical protein CK203_108668 [Vitis vinifera]
MVSRMQGRTVVRKKLNKLSSLTKSKSLQKSSVVVDGFYHINELKLRLEAMVREYSILLQNLQLPTEVKVERIHGDGLLVIKVKSWEKGRGLLVSILESLEEMGVNVVQARVSCTHGFNMEAIAEAQDKAPDIQKLTQQIHKAIAEPGHGGVVL